MSRPSRKPSERSGNRGKHRKKGDLPSKTCAVCGRPFTWRRKWAAVWDDVKYCSDRCRGERNRADAGSGRDRVGSKRDAFESPDPIGKPAGGRDGAIR